MDINELRLEIDSIDKQLTELFEKRMNTAAQIAAFKKENGVPVFDRERERSVVNKVTEMTSPELQIYTRTLYQTIFDLSRSYQKKLITPSSELAKMLDEITASSPLQIPERATVACQGVEGAYSQFACDKLFTYPSIMYFAGFEDVFKAVDSGLCRYGILPVENSTAGSVNTVYDLMKKYKFYITHSTKLCIGHSLLASAGTQLGDIKEIFSHEQAIAQSTSFLKSLGDVKLTVCENTALAAQRVALSDRDDVAALSSRMCAELYGLQILHSGVQDEGNNHTRYICISKHTEIYPGADRTSVMMTLPHKPGALYKVLARLYALGINLLKLESRPIPERDFEFMFYLDLETSVYSPEFAQLMSEIEGICSEFQYLGSYSEVL